MPGVEQLRFGKSLRRAKIPRVNSGEGSGGFFFTAWRFCGEKKRASDRHIVSWGEGVSGSFLGMITQSRQAAKKPYE